MNSERSGIDEETPHWIYEPPHVFAIPAGTATLKGTYIRVFFDLISSRALES